MEQDSREGRPYLSISVQTFRRLPQYYHYLQGLMKQGEDMVSSPTIARDLRLNEVQVRKDLAAVSKSGGKPRTGFHVPELLHNLQRYLGYDNINEAVLVGAGKLGSALLSQHLQEALDSGHQEREGSGL